MMLKQRITVVILALASTFSIYQTRCESGHGGGYSLKAAAFAPVGAVAGIFLLFFP